MSSKRHSQWPQQQQQQQSQQSHLHSVNDEVNLVHTDTGRGGDVL